MGWRNLQLPRGTGLVGLEDQEMNRKSAGEKDLQVLLGDMAPALRDGEYVFCSVEPSSFQHLQVQPLGFFHEQEGLTLILDKGAADLAGLSYQASFKMITLSIHSDLEAVGFIAAVAGRLAAAGISVNPVSAYYHDHLFIPSAQADLALEQLRQLSAESA
jgi:hypothetical protein